MKRTERTAIAAVIALSATSASAQDAIDLDAITVTANRAETAVSRSGSTVEIVTQDDLEAAGDMRVADYLARLPGISVSSSGGAGTTTTLRIRGAAGQYIGVYVDGIDVNDPSATQISFDFANLTTADVSRIEVLKGSQSALYGSEAIGGVINITTNRATKPGLSQSYAAEYGSYNTAKLSYNMSWLGKRGSFATTLSRVHTDGFSAADENAGNTEADGFDATRLSFSGDYLLSDTVTIGAAGFWQKSRADYDEYDYVAGPVDGVTPGDDISRATQLGLRGFVKVDAGQVTHELSVQYYRNDRLSEGSDAYGPYRYPYLGQRVALAYAGQAELSPDLTLAFGADATRERYESGADAGRHDMTGIYAEANWSPSQLVDVVGSVRRDHHSTFGGQTTGRLALALHPGQDVTVRLAAGTGFRTPSLYELYDSYSGNPDLGPETSDSYELGVEKQFGGGHWLRATAFHTRITDLIEWSGGSYAQVPGTGRLSGVELSSGWQLSERLTLDASYTWTDSEAPSGGRYDRVPLRDLSLHLSAVLSDTLKGDLAVQRVTGSLDGGVPLPDYTLVNVGLRYALNDRTGLYFRVENLFDEQYQTVSGYGQSDRAAYFGIRGTF